MSAAEEVTDNKAEEEETEETEWTEGKEEKCSVCKKKAQEYAYTCDECEGMVCSVECMGLTACQTQGGLCRNCFTFECCNNNCDAELDNTQTYLEDEDPTPFCDVCRAKLVAA